MTIKQLLMGTLVGVSAVSSMVQRWPKSPEPQAIAAALPKAPVKHIAKAHKHHAKSDSRLTHRNSRKKQPEVRLSLNKVFD
jgi:hypothetical protein